jgi:tetratricopeptide (TPR) repeat protein
VQDQILLILNQAVELYQLGRWEQVLKLIHLALEIQPKNTFLWGNKGVVLQKLGRHPEAVSCFDAAIAINTHSDHLAAHSANSWFNRGNSFKDLNAFQDALDSYDHALAITPNDAEIHNNRGVSLQGLKQLDLALMSFEKALSLDFGYAQAHYNRGMVFQDLGRFEEALASFDVAIRLNPTYLEAHNNRGLLLQDLNRFEEALISFEAALAIKPDYPDGCWNKALLLILLGQYREGWALYEWRWKTSSYPKARQFLAPLWLGQESLAGKTIFVYPEQGFGDFIQFCRYIHLLENMGAHVVLEVPRPLFGLISSMLGHFSMVEQGVVNEAELVDFDFQCPVMSLPLAIQTDVDTIPVPIPYLFTNDEKQSVWCNRLGPKTKKRIGLAWAGSASHKNDHNRSFSLALLAPMLEMPIEFHCLQKELRPMEAEVLQNLPQIHQHLDALKDFSDTAALIAQMDLVISVDTAVAHLAGAMGKETWILLPFMPDYRWMLDRSDCPWYPTVSLFRQTERGQWKSVIANIAEQLSLWT